MIIADENLHQYFIDRLSAAGFEIFLIREHLSGIPDYKIIAFAKNKQGLIITEDKDFGELVYAHNIKGVSIVFLRYNKADLLNVANSLLAVVADNYEKTDHYFITITATKIRISQL